MYSRLFSSILDSSINITSVPTEYRWLWVTMLLIADESRVGVVDMPPERLAAKAGLTLEDTLRGLEFLSSPDTESRSEENEGRRIVALRDGSMRQWKLINWEKYEKIASEEQRREETRIRVAEWRRKQRAEDDVTDDLLHVTKSNASEVASPSPEPEKQKQESKSPRSRASQTTARDAIEAFSPDDSHRLWAAQNAPSVPVDIETDAWKDRMRANGYRTNQGPVRSAAASWRTAIGNAEKWGTYTKKQGGGNGSGSDRTRRPAPRTLAGND